MKPFKRYLLTVAAVVVGLAPTSALAATHHALSPTTVAARMTAYLNRTMFAVPNPSLVATTTCVAHTFPGVTGQAFLCTARLGYRSGLAVVASGDGIPWRVVVVKNGNLRYTPLATDCLPPHSCNPDLNVGGPLTSG